MSRERNLFIKSGREKRRKKEEEEEEGNRSTYRLWTRVSSSYVALSLSLSLSLSNDLDATLNDCTYTLLLPFIPYPMSNNKRNASFIPAVSHLVATHNKTRFTHAETVLLPLRDSLQSVIKPFPPFSTPFVLPSSIRVDAFPRKDSSSKRGSSILRLSFSNNSFQTETIETIIGWNFDERNLVETIRSATFPDWNKSKGRSSNDLVLCSLENPA